MGALYEIFQELMYHFQICLDINSARGNVNVLKSWVDYLFPQFDSSLKEIHITILDAEIQARMVASEYGIVILEEDDGEYENGDSFKSYHHQARQPLSRLAILKDFLLMA